MYIPLGMIQLRFFLVCLMKLFWFKGFESNLHSDSYISKDTDSVADYSTN